jgi:hypothetical protein
MTDVTIPHVVHHDACIGGGGDAAPSLAVWLGLAAAPTFAVMALWTGLFGGQPDMLCTAMQGASPAGGMMMMYLLMSAFHSAPWLQLICGRQSRIAASI